MMEQDIQTETEDKETADLSDEGRPIFDGTNADVWGRQMSQWMIQRELNAGRSAFPRVHPQS